MKKLIGISLVAMLAVAPAFADPVATGTTPAAYNGNDASSVTASAEPEFALVEANSQTDGNAASAGYVKGAYNAAIKAINKVNANVNANLATSAGAGISKSDGKFSVDLTSNGGLETTGSGDAATLGVKAGNGVELGAGGVAVKAANNSISVTSSGVAVTVDGSTVEVDSTNGVQVKDDGITTAKIADSNVTAAKLATDSVTTAKIADSNVTAAKLATDSVTTAKIADGNVTFDKMAATAVQKSTNSSTYTDTSLSTKGYVDEKVASIDMSSYATKAGVKNTIDNATYTTTLGDFTLTNGTVNGTGSVAIMDTWGSDTPAATPLAVTHNFTVGTAITKGTATTTASSTYAEPNS